MLSHRMLSLLFLGLLLASLSGFRPVFAAVSGVETTDPTTPLLQVDEDAARSLIDREAESPPLDSGLAAERLEVAALARPNDDALWSDFGDVLAERSLDLLREGKVREAWESVERGKCRLFQRWSGTELELVPLEDLQLWLGGSLARMLVYSDSKSLPLLAFMIDADEIHGYELGDQWRTQPETSDPIEAWFNPSLIEKVSTANRLFVVPRHGSSRVLLSEAIDRVSAPDEAEQFLGQGPPVSFLPAASFLRGRVSPRMRAGSGFTLFTDDPSARERLTRPKDRVWLGDAASWEQFDDKDTRDSDVFYFDLPMTVGPRGDGVTLGTQPTAVSLETLAPELAADWIVALQVSAPEYSSRRNFVFRLLDRRSRSVAINMMPLSTDTAREAGETLFAQLRSGSARDEALRATRVELFAEGHSLQDCYALEIWGAGNLPVYALVPPRGIGGLVVAWVFFLVSGFAIVSFIGRRLSPVES